MKPIRLVMSAFGSYGGVEEISFDKVNCGIFLITGDTGSGKTTVFDAITYALFDETSGGFREGEMMRSQFAQDSIPTYVELTFSYGGAVYTIKRNPNYKRVSKRRNKEGAYSYTTELAAVELTMPDGTLFIGKNKEINEKIKEILGVDVSQFTQISMIAQGEFLKLLLAPSKERKEIFSRLFDTKIYWQIQQKLKEQSKELYKKLEENLILMNRELEQVWCPLEEKKEEWEQAAKRVETGKEDIFLRMEEMEVSLRTRIEKQENKENDLNQQLDKLKLQMAQGEEINSQFQQKEQVQKAIQKIEQECSARREEEAIYRKRLKDWEEAMEARLPGLDKELAEGRNLLPKYELLQRQQEEVKGLKASWQQAADRLEQAQRLEEALREEQKQLQASQKELKHQTEQLAGVEQQEKECRQRCEDIEELCRLDKRLQKLEAQLADSQKAVARALDKFEEQSREYDRCSRIFIQEQAGFLAKDLKEGESCPVCGAVHHPHKAKLSQEAVTQKQVETAKELRQKAQEKLDREKEDCVSQKEQYEGERQVYLHAGQRLFGDEASNLKPEEEGKRCSSRLMELENLCRQLEEKQKQYQAQALRLEQSQEKQQEQQEEKERLQAKAYQESLVYEKALHSLKELETTLTYPSKEVLEQKLKALKEEKQQLEQGRGMLLEKLQALAQQTAKAQGTLEVQKKNLELLTKSLEGKERADVSLLRQREALLRKDKKELEAQRLELLSGENRNRRSRQALERLYAAREKLRKTYEVAETLSRTANGNIRQQARVDLQTYVQRRYFKHIIQEANRRLIKMSSSRFVLRCRELEQLGRQGEAGLDLDVYDLVTDSIRDVKTLSGGESFLAALSMALGMADVIQKNAGKIHLDTMFIDEGFGSLDEDARGKAIQILQELAGGSRLVGIISHVTELKEQMDRKLIITKDEKGSHVKWQLES